ncbi:MAG: hypothetical protein HQL56_17255 [Magnetococcales bacterium]|nr:hypothetical protein [Magnetococcales bacterium]
MSQQVNFFQEQFVVKKDTLCAENLLLACMGLILILTAISGYMNWQGAVLQESLVMRKEQEKQEALKFAEIVKKYPIRQKSQSLEMELVKLIRDKKGKEQILQMMGGERQDNMHGFSSHLLALVESKVPGVWLDGFGLFDGGRHVLVQASTRSARLVPGYVEKLVAREVFRQNAFRLFDVAPRTDQPEVLTFQLRTKELRIGPEETPEGGGVNKEMSGPSDRLRRNLKDGKG